METVFEADSDEIDLLASYLSEQVRHLSITNCVDGSITHALQKFKNLRSIHIDRSPRWTTADINTLAKSSGRRLTIFIEDCTNADEKFLDSVSECFSPNFFCSLDGSTGESKSKSSKQAILRSRAGEALLRNSCRDLPITRSSQDTTYCSFVNSDEGNVYQFAKQFKKTGLLEFRKCHFTSFNAWQGSSNLKKITFGDCDNLKSIKGLANFESLANLRITNAPQLTSVEAGQSISKLKSLYLNNLPLFGKFNSLAQFELLHSVSINSCNLLTDISWMSGMEKLREVTVNNCPLRQVTHLKSLPSLEKLEFKYCDSLSKFTDCEFDPSTRLIVDGSAFSTVKNADKPQTSGQ